MKKHALIALAASVAMIGTALAQSASLVTSINGRVLVSTDIGLVLAKPGMSVSDGARVVTTAGASAIITTARGCVVSIRANSELRIDSATPCDALQRSAQASAPSPVDGGQVEELGLSSSIVQQLAAVLGIDAASALALIGVIGVGGAAAVINAANNNNNASPS